MSANESAANEDARKAICDQIVNQAAEMMVDMIGTSVEMMIDRMITYCGAQIVALEGSPRAAEVFRLTADKIDAGLFHSVERAAKEGTH